MNQVILFGAGSFTERHLSYMEKYLDILAVCDNNAALQGKMFAGRYRIISVEELKEKYEGCDLLVSLNDRKNFDTVSRQLSALGLSHRHVNDALYDACIANREYFCLDGHNEKEIEKLHTSIRNLIVITAPAHSNLGDQAQSYCTETILREQYKGSNLFIYDEHAARDNYYELLYIVKQSLKPEDIVLLHSGYRLTDLYMSTEYTTEMMGRLFWNHKMVFLPQTVYFQDENIKERMSRSVNENVVIMCRDRISYRNAREMFCKSKIILCPDMVTSLIGRMKFDSERRGILLCLRNADDGESLLSDEGSARMAEELGQLGEVTVTDTTIDVDWRMIAADRKKYVEKEIAYYAQFELIVTNRYHGTIFSLAADTPVIVLPTKDHKVTAGLQWFEEAGFEGIYCCEEMDMILSMAREIITNPKKIRHTDYFYRHYFENFDLEGSRWNTD